VRSELVTETLRALSKEIHPRVASVTSAEIERDSVYMQLFYVQVGMSCSTVASAVPLLITKVNTAIGEVGAAKSAVGSQSVVT